jgi:hypothetical protein
VTPLPTAPTVIAQLCRDAVDTRKKAVIADGRSSSRLVLLGQLSGIRLALCRLHGWTDHSPQGPAAAFILDWWKQNLPGEWEDGTAYANVLYFDLAELLAHNTTYRSIAHLNDAMGAAVSTTYKTFTAPEQTSWENLSTYVTFLGGDLKHFRILWCQARMGGIP